MDDAAYLRAICWTPFDDGPRLVWADALDERGECARAEFVRVQCELARLPNYEMCLGTCAPPDFEGCPHRAQRRREWELAVRCAVWAGADGVARALGADHVRRLGLSMGFTDLEFSLGGRPVALGEFRRGLVGSVTLTAAQFFGGPCGRCEGRGGWAPGKGNVVSCEVCSGTGRVKGVAATLFRAAPVTEVRLSDKRPMRILAASGKFRFGYEQADDNAADAWQIPGPIFQHLPRGDFWANKYRRWWYDEADALSALSTACVALGRARAKLSALPRVAVPTSGA